MQAMQCTTRVGVKSRDQYDIDMQISVLGVHNDFWPMIVVDSAVAGCNPDLHKLHKYSNAACSIMIMQCKWVI